MEVWDMVLVFLVSFFPSSSFYRRLNNNRKLFREYVDTNVDIYVCIYLCAYV